MKHAYIYGYLLEGRPLVTNLSYIYLSFLFYYLFPWSAKLTRFSFDLYRIVFECNLKKEVVVYLLASRKTKMQDRIYVTRSKYIMIDTKALLVELVNTVDLKSILARVVGSSPTEGIRRSGRVVNGGRL